MQKIFMFLMAVSLVLGFTACGGGGGNDNTISPLGSDRKPETNIVDKIKGSLPGPFVGDKAGQFGEFDISTEKGYQDLVKAVKDGALFLDVRNDYERDNDYYAAGTVTGAIYEFRKSKKNGTNPDFINAVTSMVDNDKNRQIILICHSGSRTSSASKWLASTTKWGNFNGGNFTNVYHVKGGLKAWERAGRPMGKEPLK